MIEICGGNDPFSHHREFFDAKRRILPNTDVIVDINPDMILASWCGKLFKKDRMLKRDNWNIIKAVINDEIHEIDSAVILQPGPAALTEGIDILDELIRNFLAKRK